MTAVVATPPAVTAIFVGVIIRGLIVPLTWFRNNAQPGTASNEALAVVLDVPSSRRGLRCGEIAPCDEGIFLVIKALELRTTLSETGPHWPREPGRETGVCVMSGRVSSTHSQHPTTGRHKRYRCVSGTLAPCGGSCSPPEVSRACAALNVQRPPVIFPCPPAM